MNSVHALSSTAPPRRSSTRSAASTSTRRQGASSNGRHRRPRRHSCATGTGTGGCSSPARHRECRSSRRPAGSSGRSSRAAPTAPSDPRTFLLHPAAVRFLVEPVNDERLGPRAPADQVEPVLGHDHARALLMRVLLLSRTCISIDRTVRVAGERTFLVELNE